MQCLVCKKEFRFLGGHLQRTHGISAKEYRQEFGLLLEAPLLDPDLQVARSEAMRRRIKTEPDYLAMLQNLCSQNSKLRVGTSTRGQISQAGRSVLSQKIKAEPKDARRRLTRETGNPAAKLTPLQAAEIALSSGPQQATAVKYGISQTMVSYLRRTWKPE